ncbi:hypothetical protein A2U01_0028664, partial [Trifolium medium]|nr:hypothetical protein [Trifolium medium]
GSFTANTETNPKDCKSIKTRSGIEIGKGIDDNLEKPRNIVEASEKQKMEGEESDDEAEEKNKKEVLVENKKNECEGEVSEERENTNQKSKGKSIQKSPPTQHLSYPPIPTKKDKERQFARFMDIFKKLQINLPFSEALEQMPTYAKFMKEILTKKRKINEEEII